MDIDDSSFSIDIDEKSLRDSIISNSSISLFDIDTRSNDSITVITNEVSKKHVNTKRTNKKNDKISNEKKQEIDKETFDNLITRLYRPFHNLELLKSRSAIRYKIEWSDGTVEYNKGGWIMNIYSDFISICNKITIKYKGSFIWTVYRNPHHDIYGKGKITWYRKLTAEEIYDKYIFLKQKYNSLTKKYKVIKRKLCLKK